MESAKAFDGVNPNDFASTLSFLLGQFQPTSLSV